MEIKCFPKEGRKGIFILEVDGDPWRDIHSSIFGKRPTFPQFENYQEFESYLQAQELKGARNCAIRRLSIKSYPSAELDKVLKERLVSEDNRQQIIKEFIDLGYIKDEEWIESFIQQQINKKVGPRVISQKLRVKGISEPVSMSDETQKEQIQSLLSSKYRSRDLSDYKEKQKVIASLMRKGFELDCIMERINLENENIII